jgi:hypothetical protein
MGVFFSMVDYEMLDIGACNIGVVYAGNRTGIFFVSGMDEIRRGGHLGDKSPARGSR